MNKNILIVDDSLVDRKFFSAILQNKIQNISIVESDDSLHVVDDMINHDISLCILDIMMPGKDGYQVLKEVKENPITRNIPVIICTGVYDLEGIEKTLTLGATDFFTKPLSEQDIKIALPLKVNNALKNYANLSEIEKLSYFDTLTNVYNRKFYESKLDLINKEENLPLSLAIFDINGLKIINDYFGFKKGDEYLKRFASLLSESFCNGNIVSRIGGDEFAVIMPRTDQKTALRKITAFTKQIHKERIESMRFSVAFGLAVKTKKEMRVNELIKKAEDKLYENKLFEGSSVRNKTLNVILNILHEKNIREKKHSDRVSEYAKKLAIQMGLDEMSVKLTMMTAILHDIGKIAIDESILNKDGKLTDEEYAEIKRHPEIGFRILQTVPEMVDISEIVLSHHEYYDGRGYPRGLAAGEIPLISRIISVADAFDAMTSPRTYREPMTVEEAAKELQRCSGTQFDPQVVDVFINSIISTAS